MKMTISRSIVSLTLVFAALGTDAIAQYDTIKADKKSDAKIIRKIGVETLEKMKLEIQSRYYDKTYHGIDLDARFKEASDKIKQAESRAQIFRITAQLLTEFNDSHTHFIPLNRANTVEYGFSFQIVGNKCMITSVKKGSDAEAKGLKAGDIVAGIASYNPTRENLWKLQYVLYTLDPQAAIKIYVANPDGSERELQIESKFRTWDEIAKENRKKGIKDEVAKCVELDASTEACRLDSFEVETDIIDKIMKQVDAHPNMILDLRGNRGGYVKTEEYFVGYFFDRDVKIGDFVTRGKNEERIAKSKGKNYYQGNLSVLVDSESASAAEVFARVMQLEKRGKVVGDVSSGAVMTSIFIPIRGDFEADAEKSTSSYSGLSLTIGDLIMSDGKRLETAGVIPDLPARPTPAAYRNRLDVVLSYAAKQVGATITPEAAGKLHFIFPQDEDAEPPPAKKTEIKP